MTIDYESDQRKRTFLYKAFHSNKVLNSKFSFFPFELSSFAETPALLEEVQSFIDQAHCQGKQTVFYFSHDNDHPISEFLHGDPFVFRNSMSKNFEYINEYNIPSHVDNFRQSVIALNKLEWNLVPRVSFMGWATVAKPITDKLRGHGLSKTKGLISPAVFPTPTSIGTVLRKKAIEIIEGDERIESSFTIFDRFFPHYPEEFKMANRQQYLDSMCNTHYVLTIRGCGNYSMRHFETLAAGRIPVLVDTNQHLPFESEIAWKDSGVWIPFEDFNSISDLIFDFHSNLDKNRFNELTFHNEDIYQKFVTREGVIRQIQKILMRNL